MSIDNKKLFNLIPEIYSSLQENGLLLASTGSECSVNVMTIGWSHIGILWRRPFFIAYIRKSRYTHNLVEETGDFTINIPPKNFKHVTEFCGTKSGRQVNKVKELGLKVESSKIVKSPSLSECPITLECKIIFKKEIESKDIPSNIKDTFYTKDDYHTCYFAEIVNLTIR
ncbi:MAG: flavin reductase family protein [Nitrososphaeria archaeon]|nr:flavin reductase family protein [Nitrososphaeria archaeon]